jgi:hypothetical protein
VYCVRDKKTDRRLALKRLLTKDRHRAAKQQALLQREFHTLAHLRHPRIIEVYDYGFDAAGPYYTMELLDGADLDQGGRVPWQEACALLHDIASSLAIVHSRGLIHRDVSARNVRRTADGHAKLIDFGAMVSMGVANDVIGTAPFMSPELLQMQALDARSDLFSLGALGYYLLLGRHAYPARRTSELRDIWRSRPVPPSRAMPEIPAALSALVLQLLSLDRSARPQAASEVMERLRVIGDLPKEELPEIARAYLTTPTLVGRNETLLAIRSRMLSLVRGDGGAILVEAPAGVGRSRMIDASVFEGKLLNALVLRADSGDASEPWNVARVIASQLFTLIPAEALEAARLSSGILAHVIDELQSEDAAHTETMSFPERSLLLRELRDFVLVLGKRHRLVIVVDDADRLDEPSTAWLAALVDKADRQSVLVVFSMEPALGHDESPALGLLRSLAHRVEMQPLDADQTESLTRSVFGEVSNLGLLAGRVYALAHGNPRATMELLQHLVDRGLARYEAGSWLLPKQFDSADLPATLSESLLRRLDALQPDARDVADALAIADAHSFSATMYAALTPQLDQNRLFLALEELVSARVLVTGRESYRFSQRGFLSVLLSAMPPQRKTALHKSMSALLARSGGDIVTRTQHLMAGGCQAQAIALLCSLDLQVRLPPLALLEAAVVYAEQMGTLPARAIHRLRMAVLSKAALLVESASFRRWLPPALEQLEKDSGLAAYRELSDTLESERLSRALTIQQQRYLAMSPDQQVYAVGDGVRELARLTGSGLSISIGAHDVQLLESFPALDALYPLSPSLRVIEELKNAIRYWLSGRHELARQLYEAALERIREPDRAGFDDAQFQRTEVAIEYVLALHEATQGIDRAEQRAQFLESHRALRVNAWRVRSLLQLSQGDDQGARKSRRRAELLQLQDEREVHYPGTGAGLHLQAYFLAADIVGVKQLLEELASYIDKYPCWRLMRVYGQTCFRYLSGDYSGALDLVVTGLETARAGRDMFWGHLAAQHIRVLRELGRTAESIECGRVYCALAHAESLTMAGRFVVMEGALTHAAAGLHAEAVAILEPQIQQVESAGSRGLALGVFYEARARIAIAMRDKRGFEQHAEQCAREYGLKPNPALSAKFARLVEEARQSELVQVESSTFENVLSLVPSAAEREDDSTISRMLECVDTADRARCALTMLLQSTHGYFGHLYGLRGERLVALAGIPNSEAEPDLERWLNDWFAAERERIAHVGAMTTAENEVTQNVEAPQTEISTLSGGAHESTSVFTNTEGQRFSAMMLKVDHATHSTIAGVLLLNVESFQHRRPSAGLLSKIAKQLLAQGDTQGITLASPLS